MSTLSEPTLDISPAELEELFEAPAFEHDKGYRLVLMDDDVTPQNYVVLVLVTIFAMEPQKAVELMLRVHEHGRAEVFKGSFEECTEKKDAIGVLNEAYGFHLFSLVEKVE
jgi:ATP-dependent Clp protease adapter protein ClpS